MTDSSTTRSVSMPVDEGLVCPDPEPGGPSRGSTRPCSLGRDGDRAASTASGWFPARKDALNSSGSKRSEALVCCARSLPSRTCRRVSVLVPEGRRKVPGAPKARGRVRGSIEGQRHRQSPSTTIRDPDMEPGHPARLFPGLFSFFFSIPWKIRWASFLSKLDRLLKWSVHGHVSKLIEMIRASGPGLGSSGCRLSCGFIVYSLYELCALVDWHSSDICRQSVSLTLFPVAVALSRKGSRCVSQAMTASRSLLPRFGESVVSKPQTRVI